MTDRQKDLDRSTFMTGAVGVAATLGAGRGQLAEVDPGLGVTAPSRGRGSPFSDVDDGVLVDRVRLGQAVAELGGADVLVLVVRGEDVFDLGRRGGRVGAQPLLQLAAAGRAVAEEVVEVSHW